MSSHSYVPRSGAAFCSWAKNLYTYVIKHQDSWEIPKIPPALADDLIKLDELVARCAAPGHTDLDTGAKNDLWRSVEKETRAYVQGLVIRNPAVTDDDRRAMALPVRDATPTPIGDPVGEVVADVAYSGRSELMLSIRHVEGTPFDRRANYGVKIAWDILPFDSPAPRSASELHRSVFTRRKKEPFTFEQSDAGKKAWFSLRYENSKGRAGYWGQIFSAVIP